MTQPIAGSGRGLLRPLQLTAVVFFTVSGGPYGLEPVLQYVGGGFALALILITPLLWVLPSILMVLELNGMMPLNGGYYQWVKSGLGMKWGFYEGWWSWLFTFTDLAIYPVLFVQYLSFFYPEAGVYKIPICLAIIWVAAVLNLLGIIPVGRSSVLLGLCVLVPFGILFGVAVTKGFSFSLSGVNFQTHGMGFTVFGMGLYTVMWNFLGWDNSSSFVEEVHRPARSYLISIVVAFFLIVGFYFLSIWTGTAAGMDAEVLTAQGFPSLGLHIGGWWLGAILSFGGIASALGLFLSILLAISRVPKAMADDGLLPASLSKVHPKHNVPHVSIVVCALVVSGMVFWEFGDLLIIDVTLYGAALFLEFVALIVLRIRNPEQPRPFKIPLNVAGLIAMTALPTVCLVTALTAALSEQTTYTNATLFAVAAVLTAPIAWKITSMRIARQS
ncbi:MAG: APC family permease [Ignavibacteriales bacterium]|nr:APC family permease [Ignavibacteriales bacterium]